MGCRQEREAGPPMAPSRPATREAVPSTKAAATTTAGVAERAGWGDDGRRHLGGEQSPTEQPRSLRWTTAGWHQGARHTPGAGERWAAAVRTSVAWEGRATTATTRRPQRVRQRRVARRPRTSSRRAAAASGGRAETTAAAAPWTGSAARPTPQAAVAPWTGTAASLVVGGPSGCSWWPLGPRGGRRPWRSRLEVALAVVGWWRLGEARWGKVTCVALCARGSVVTTSPSPKVWTPGGGRAPWVAVRATTTTTARNPAPLADGERQDQRRTARTKESAGDTRCVGGNRCAGAWGGRLARQARHLFDVDSPAPPSRPIHTDS